MELQKKEEFNRIPGLSVESSLLINFLKDKQIGDVVTDEEMTNVIGKITSPNFPGYPFLQTAIKHCINNYGKVFGRIREAKAIKCLNPDEIASDCKGTVKKLSRYSKRAVKKVKTVDISKLSQDKQLELSRISAQISALAMISSNSTTKQLEVRIQRPDELVADKTKLLNIFKTA